MNVYLNYIFLKGEVIGVAQIVNKKNGQEFTEDDIQVISVRIIFRASKTVFFLSGQATKKKTVISFAGSLSNYDSVSH